MKSVEKMLVAGGAALGAVAMMAFAPAQAQAFPLPGPGLCNYPGTSGGGTVMGFGGYWCDYPPVSTGQHYHCEWATAMFSGGGCTWRDGGNAVVSPPPPEVIFW